MLTIKCLAKNVVSGLNHYPIYIGFVKAEDILKIAEAPGFTKVTDHQVISTNVLTPPIKDWQRPLNDDRVSEISHAFDDTGEIMPNPVLLCINVSLSEKHKISISTELVAGSTPTGITNINVKIPLDGQEKPFWILDGQHRINGLAKSKQKKNEIPVVFLINQDNEVYSGPLVAKLFAQVTTEATKLDELHDEWLTFAFNLRRYSPTKDIGNQNHNSMEAVAILCQRPILGGITNRFCNHVKFNIHRTVSPSPGGFVYTCTDMKELIKNHYYSCSATIGRHLSPADLAEQICLAHNALLQVVKAPQNETVFFGGQDYGQKIMQDAFFIGVYTYLLNYGKPANWKTVLEDLTFDSSNWNFRSWCASLGGKEQTNSRSIAIRLFSSVFRDKSLIPSSGTVVDFLKGNEAKVVIRFSNLSPAGRPTQKGCVEKVVTSGSNTSPTVVPAKHFKVVSETINIGKVEIIDREHPPGKVITYKKSGEYLQSPKNNPLKIEVRMYHYGGQEAKGILEIGY